MDNQAQQFDDEIELSELFNILKRNIKLISITALVFTVVGFLFTFFMIKPQYESQATVIVNNRRDENTSITNEELNSAQNLASVYSIIIKSDTVLDQVIDNLNLDATAKELSSKVTVSAVNNSQVMKISTKDFSPEEAYAITNEVVNIAPDIIIEMVEAGSVKVISNASLSENKVSPNLKMNVLISFVLGAMVSVGYVFVKHMLDNTFKSESDIEKILELPVLGIIPNVESARNVK